MVLRARSTAVLLAYTSVACATGEPDAIAQAFMQSHHVPGLAYAVLVNGAMVTRGACGVSDTTTRAKVTINSVFPIASLSKPFVAIGVMSLIERGQVGLHDPIGKYLPELPGEWKRIPILRLLDHTSGIPDHFNSGKYPVYDAAPLASDELVKKLAALPLTFAEGEKYEYSNGNYVLLAKLIERVTGKLYEAYLNEKIFAPLGLKSTKALVAADLPNVVQGYVEGKDGNKPQSFNPDWCYGNGALGSTISDLAKLDAALYTERLLRSSTLAFLTTPQPLNDGKLPNYAMGWQVGKCRGVRAISHSGKVGGWQSYFERFPDLNATVIVVVNNGNTKGLGTVAADLAGTVLPTLALLPVSDQYPALTADHRRFIESVVANEVEVDRLSDFLRGDYESKDHWESLRKTLSEGGKILAFNPVERRQTGPDGFQTTYRLDQNDRAWSIELRWNGHGTITGLIFKGG